MKFSFSSTPDHNAGLSPLQVSIDNSTTWSGTVGKLLFQAGGGVMNGEKSGSEPSHRLLEGIITKKEREFMTQLATYLWMAAAAIDGLVLSAMVYQFVMGAL